jgi:hypothetical protein
MQLVKFSRDMAPYNKGDTRLVPDDLADTLMKSGDIDDMQPFPESGSEPAPKRKKLSLGLGRPGKQYDTR